MPFAFNFSQRVEHKQRLSCWLFEQVGWIKRDVLTCEAGPIIRYIKGRIVCLVILYWLCMRLDYDIIVYNIKVSNLIFVAVNYGWNNIKINILVAKAKTEIFAKNCFSPICWWLYPLFVCFTIKTYLKNRKIKYNSIIKFINRSYKISYLQVLLDLNRDQMGLRNLSQKSYKSFFNSQIIFIGLVE